MTFCNQLSISHIYIYICSVCFWDSYANEANEVENRDLLIASFNFDSIIFQVNDDYDIRENEREREKEENYTTLSIHLHFSK